MQCPECKAELMIGNSKFEVQGDNSPETSTELYSVLTMVCINGNIDPDTKKPKCSLYCGKDLNNPLKVAAVIKNKVDING